MVAVFFSLYRARVTRDEPGFFEWGSKIGIDLSKSACKPMANRACLAGDASALNIHLGIKIPAGLGHLERLEDNHSGCLAAEIIAESPIIDHKTSFARLQGHPSHGRFASPGRIEYLFCHSLLLNYGQRLGLLGYVRMIRPSVNF